MKGGASSHLISQVNKKLGEQEPEISSKLLNMKFMQRASDNQTAVQIHKSSLSKQQSREGESKASEFNYPSYGAEKKTGFSQDNKFNKIQFKDRRGQVSDSDTESEDEDP